MSQPKDNIQVDKRASQEADVEQRVQGMNPRSSYKLNNEEEQVPEIQSTGIFKSNNKKKKLQLSWDRIVIKALPKMKKCGRAIEPPPQPKTILNDVSGTVMPGQFLAIIGASGAGKTTLLNFLSGREISKNLAKTGTIRLNGVEKDKIKRFASLTAYVQ